MEPTDPTTPSPPAPTEPPRGRRAWLGWVTALLVGALAAGAVLWLTAERRELRDELTVLDQQIESVRAEVETAQLSKANEEKRLDDRAQVARTCLQAAREEARATARMSKAFDAVLVGDIDQFFSRLLAAGAVGGAATSSEKRCDRERKGLDS